MTVVLAHTIPGSSLMNIAYYQQAYYVTRNDHSVLIIDSNNLSTINSIKHSSIDRPRDMIFLDNGRTMILASAGNKALIFFNLTNNQTRKYVYSSRISTSYSSPHGLWYVNDSFFYATSWDDKKIYSHSTNNNVSWTEGFFGDSGSASGSKRAGSHVTVDDSQRIWFSSNDVRMVIFARNGTPLSSFYSALTGVFDTLFMDNYVMFLSDDGGNRIVRFDPTITL